MSGGYIDSDWGSDWHRGFGSNWHGGGWSFWHKDGCSGDTKVAPWVDKESSIHTNGGGFHEEPSDPTLLTAYVDYVTFKLRQGDV